MTAAEDRGDVFTFENLGGGQEVGRSCHVLQFKGKCVMVWGLLERVNRSWTRVSILPYLVWQDCLTTIHSI
jgi:cleavage and polyadenylation specificity factor subunit 3